MKVIALQDGKKFSKGNIYNIVIIDGYSVIQNSKGECLCDLYSNMGRMCFKEYIENGDELKMKKSDLRSGYVVKLRNGDTPIVMLYVETESKAYTEMNVFSYMEGEHIDFDSYNDDLTIQYGRNSQFDIMEIYKPKAVNFIFKSDLSKFTKIWSRDKVKEFTIEECAKALGVPVEEFKLVEKR